MKKSIMLVVILAAILMTTVAHAGSVLPKGLWVNYMSGGVYSNRAVMYKGSAKDGTTVMRHTFYLRDSGSGIVEVTVTKGETFYMGDSPVKMTVTVKDEYGAMSAVIEELW